MSEKIEKVEKYLHEIQTTLNAPKGNYNKFGQFNYRNVEDILRAVKPLMQEDTYLRLNDEVIEVAGRIYVKALASFHYGSTFVSASALAREPLSKKGMDEMQITGSASSYARKYALCGLFAIDNEKDSDSQKPSIQNESEDEELDPSGFIIKIGYAKGKPISSLTEKQMNQQYDFWATKNSNEAREFIAAIDNYRNDQAKR